MRFMENCFIKKQFSLFFCSLFIIKILLGMSSSDKIKKVIGKYGYYLTDEIGCGYSSTVYSGKQEDTSIHTLI